MRETIFLIALAGATSGIGLRVVEPMLPRLAEDFATGFTPRLRCPRPAQPLYFATSLA